MTRPVAGRAALLAAMQTTLDALPPGPLGVAVSGGGDSTALLLLTRYWAAEQGRGIAAVTVDHSLRPESSAEAKAVAQLCASHGISHTILRWSGWDGRGNLQDRARDARRVLIAEWACGRALASVAVGHTLDDQAETFLMRLARGSGVDGLGAMHALHEAQGVIWSRPMLTLRRSDLRTWLLSEGVGWVEDRSNDNPRFDRVRARQALTPLATMGLGIERLAATAAAMARAREALEAGTAELARRCLTPGVAGDLRLEPSVLKSAPLELRLRLLAAALNWVSGAIYRPRLARLEMALAAIESGDLGHGITLHGCVLRPRKDGLAIRRELARVASPVQLARGVWDGRWCLEGPAPDNPGLRIGALGVAGLAQCPRWRDRGLAREALLTTPALWLGEVPFAAPFARSDEGLASSVRFRRISAVSPPWQDTLLR